MRNLRRRGTAIAALALLVPSAVFAQAPAGGQRERRPGDEDAEQTVRTAAGDRLARLALLFIRGVQDPMPEDYRLTALLLNEGLALSPQNHDILRLLLETSHAAGDREAALRHTERLLRREPDNTVLQLRLITDRIARLQRVEARLEAYDRFLGERGEALSPSLRSRLALDAALLAREIGDEAGFIERLKKSVRLDQTNKQAAVLAASYAVPRLDDPVARVELLANVVLADPLDYRTQLNLAQELISHAAYDLAERFYLNCVTLLRAVGESPESLLGPELMAVRWGTRGADFVLDEYALTEEEQRRMLALRRQSLESSGGDPSTVPPWRYEGSLEVIRLAAANAIGRVEDEESAFERMSTLLSNRIEQMKERLAGGESERPEEGEETLRRQRALLLWLHLWAGRELDGAEELLGTISEDLEPTARRRFEGWLALQRGELERAESLLEPIAEEDARARLGLGLALERRGQTDRAVSQYARVALARPEASLGLWARSRIERLIGRGLRPTDTVRAIDASLAALPRDLDRLVRDPDSLLSLVGRHEASVASPVERVDLRVTLRNTASFPMAVGDRAPISASLLLAPKITSEGRLLRTGVGPEVVDLGRRLRLDSGEAIDITVWASRGSAGDALDEIAARDASLRWTLLHGFEQEEPSEQTTALFKKGPFGLSAETDSLRRAGVTPPGDSIESYRRALEQASGERALELILYTRERLRRERAARRTEERRALFEALRRGGADDRSIARFFSALAEGQQELVDIVTDRFPEVARLLDEFEEWISPTAEALAAVYPHLTALQRTFVLTALPPARVDPPMRPLDEAARADDARLPGLVFLLTRTGSVEDARLVEALESDDEVVRTVATLLSDRFEQMSVAANEAVE